MRLLLCLFATLVAGTDARLRHKAEFGTVEEWQAKQDEHAQRASEARASGRTRDVDDWVAAQSKADHLVTALPGLDADDLPELYSGHIEVDSEHRGRLHYWYFPTEADDSGNDVPLVMWINGGPGCSSNYGVFVENGPLRLQEDGTMLIAKSSWHTKYNMLFIDQPVGTGLSYVDAGHEVTNHGQVNAHLYKFYERFFELFPELAGRALYFSGESFAGSYLPSLAEHVVRTVDGDTSLFNLQGLMLGNPWFDAPTQNPGYIDFSLGQGLIDYHAYVGLNKKYPADDCAGSRCSAVYSDIIRASGHRILVNVYDTRDHTANTDLWPMEMTRTAPYLNRDAVRAAIHAETSPKEYADCDDPVYFALADKMDESVMSSLTYVLEAGVRVLVFVGQYDFICNTAGVMRALDVLDWNGRDTYLEAQTQIWEANGDLAGYVRETPNGELTYVMMHSGSHMVIYDQQEEGLDLAVTFIEHQTWGHGHRTTLLETDDFQGTCTMSDPDVESACPFDLDHMPTQGDCDSQSSNNENEKTGDDDDEDDDKSGDSAGRVFGYLLLSTVMAAIGFGLGFLYSRRRAARAGQQVSETEFQPVAGSGGGGSGGGNDGL